MNNPKITKIITARNSEFNAGRSWQTSNSAVTEITFAIGDPTIGDSSCYIVKFDDGEKVEVYDAVEVWYAS